MAKKLTIKKPTGFISKTSSVVIHDNSGREFYAKRVKRGEVKLNVHGGTYYTDRRVLRQLRRFRYKGKRVQQSNVIKESNREKLKEMESKKKQK